MLVKFPAKNRLRTFSGRLPRLFPLTTRSNCTPQSMPPNLRGSLPKSLSRPLDSGGVFYCPSCSTWRRTISTRRKTYRPSTGASTGTSTKASTSSIIPRGQNEGLNTQRHQFTTSSAINAGKNVPPRFKELYAALNRVGDVATDRVNLSRLQLALRGLESEEPLVRVAGGFISHMSVERRGMVLTVICSARIERYECRAQTCPAVAFRSIIVERRLGRHARGISG